MLTLPVVACVPTPGLHGGIIEPRHLRFIKAMGFAGVRQNVHANNPDARAMIRALVDHLLIPNISFDFRTHKNPPEMPPDHYRQQAFDLARWTAAEGIVEQVGRLIVEPDNEPKIHGSTPPGVFAAYARTFFDAWRAGNPQATLLLPGEIYEAPVNGRRRLGKWFEQMIQRLGLDIAALFDGLAIHPYTNDGGWPDQTVFDDYRRIGLGLPLYVTEVGAKPTEPRGQAAMVRQELLNEDAADVRWSAIYQLRSGTDPAMDFGMLNPDESPRELAYVLADLMGGTVEPPHA